MSDERRCATCDHAFGDHDENDASCDKCECAAFVPEERRQGERRVAVDPIAVDRCEESGLGRKAIRRASDRRAVPSPTESARAGSEGELTAHSGGKAGDRPKGRAAAYAGIYPSLVEIGREHGYAVAVHGSLARDLDLIATPWVEHYSAPDDFVKDIAYKLGAIAGEDLVVVWPNDPRWGPKPHGRLCYTIVLDGGAFIDLSVIPPHTAPTNAPDPASPPTPAEPRAAEERRTPKCEGGIAVSWCPRCGDCSCSVEERALGDMRDDCTIHGRTSTHVPDDEEGARCTCEWQHPMDGTIDAAFPAELDPQCRVHGAPNDWPRAAEAPRSGEGAPFATPVRVCPTTGFVVDAENFTVVQESSDADFVARAINAYANHSQEVGP